MCIVHARPAANVIWTKDGEQVYGDNNVAEHEGGHRHILTITQVSENNFGNYLCSANNEFGSSEASISLTGRNCCLFLFIWTTKLADFFSMISSIWDILKICLLF